MGKIVSNEIRNSANGEMCTMQIPGVCNYNPDTVVLAHLPDESNGMGTKSDDISACYACSGCHDAMDGRVISELYNEDKEFFMRRAQTRTLRRLLEKGIVSIKDVDL